MTGRALFPRIVAAALKLRQEHFAIDGEVVVLDADGVSGFDALHPSKHHRRAQLNAFDMLAGDGADHRQLTLALRQANLARLLSRRVDGIFIADYEQGEIGVDLFRVACTMGHRLEASRSRLWRRPMKPAHPAYSRVGGQLPRVVQSRR